MKFFALLIPLVLTFSLQVRADEEVATEDFNIAAQVDENGEPAKVDMTQEQINQNSENEAHASLDNEVDHMEGPAHPEQNVAQEEVTYEKSLGTAPPPHIIGGEGTPAVSESSKFKHRYRVPGGGKVAHNKHKSQSKKVVAHGKNKKSKRVKIAKSKGAHGKKKNHLAGKKNSKRQVARR